MRVKTPSSKTRIELEDWEVKLLVKAAAELSEAYGAQESESRRAWRPGTPVERSVISGDSFLFLTDLAKLLAK